MKKYEMEYEIYLYHEENFNEFLIEKLFNGSTEVSAFDYMETAEYTFEEDLKNIKLKNGYNKINL